MPRWLMSRIYECYVHDVAYSDPYSLYGALMRAYGVIPGDDQKSTLDPIFTPNVSQCSESDVIVTQ